MLGRQASKINPSPIVLSHLRVLVDGDGNRSRRDYLEQFGIPAGLGLALFVGGVTISATTATAVLTLAALLAAFLFQLTVQLLDRAADWAQSDPAPGPSTSRYAELLEELSASAGYASIISAATASGALGVAITSRGWQEHLLAAITVALLLHLAATLLLVARRVFLLTKERLNTARTGTPSRPH